MRDDVAHFRRLGLGCIRVHCFERQFSDREGNLLDNEHLALLDELIDVCREQGLYTVLTPIAWWGGGVWTERTQGFSDFHTMRELTADRATWPAQARFLKQFAEHVNRITGRRYADDPCVLAFECINEPLYPKGTPDSLVTDYINTLADALRASGTTKPIYYNSWQGRNAAAGASRVDGVTCAIYPGLVAGYELEGPQLGRVRATSLQPDASIAQVAHGLRVRRRRMNGSYMFPAMASCSAPRVQVAPVSIRPHAAGGCEPQLADPPPESGLHAEQSDFAGYRRRGLCPRTARRVVHAGRYRDALPPFRVSATENLRNW